MNDRQLDTEKRIPVKVFIFFALYILVFPAIPFIAAGTWRWPVGWWYYGASVAATVISRLIVAFINPDQLRERGTGGSAENVKSWDRLLSNLVGLSLPTLTLVIVGLDRRWFWSPPLPGWVAPLAFAGLLVGYALATWAFIANRFFSGYVRIQEERGHEVVSAGPYGLVRHPGYLGGLLSIMATPALLGSLWGYIPVLFYCAAIVTRTALEDITLQDELEGYKEYARRTRFRLIPGLW